LTVSSHEPVTVRLTTDLGYMTEQIRPDGRSNLVAMIYDIRPVGKPSMTAKSKYTKVSAVEYLTKFCPAMRAGFNRAAKYQMCEFIGVAAYFKTEDESLLWKRHEQKPDCKNILAGIEDALLIDDSRNGISCEKFWGPQDAIEITLTGVTYSI
jgi:hypothetical protein